MHGKFCKPRCYFCLFGPNITLNPLSALVTGSAANGCAMRARSRAMRASRNFLSRYFSLPRSAKSTLILFPSLRNSSACRALSARSCCEVPMPMRTLLISTSFRCFAACRAFFSCSYRYLPRSVIFATGGLAVGAISIKSRPTSMARRSASSREMTPRLEPS